MNIILIKIGIVLIYSDTVIRYMEYLRVARKRIKWFDYLIASIPIIREFYMLLWWMYGNNNGEGCLFLSEKRNKVLGKVYYLQDYENKIWGGGMLSYNILRERYKELQEKYREVVKESDRRDDDIRKLEKEIKDLHRQIGVKEKEKKEKDLIIGWLIDKWR